MRCRVNSVQAGISAGGECCIPPLKRRVETLDIDAWHDNGGAIMPQLEVLYAPAFAKLSVDPSGVYQSSGGTSEDGWSNLRPNHTV